MKIVKFLYSNCTSYLQNWSHFLLQKVIDTFSSFIGSEFELEKRKPARTHEGKSLENARRKHNTNEKKVNRVSGSQKHKKVQDKINFKYLKSEFLITFKTFYDKIVKGGSETNLMKCVYKAMEGRFEERGMELSAVKENDNGEPIKGKA